MASASFTIRGLGGTKTVTIDSDEPISVADIREAADIAEGVLLRQNGENVTDEDETYVESGATLVSAPAAAKHGVLV